LVVEAPPRRRAKPPGRTKRVTITIPADVLAAAQCLVDEGKAASLSAYISGALAKQVALDQGKDGFIAFLDQLDAELGPPSPEDYAEARRFLGL